MTGTFITIDGPGGSGKTATAAALASLLRADGHTVHETAEPTTGPIGMLTRAMVNQVHGHALACLVAADRYHHLDTEIRPERAAGHIVVCDRYLASTLVLQARDGVPVPYLLSVNDGIDLPDLAVILSAAPEIIAARAGPARAARPVRARPPLGEHRDCAIRRCRGDAGRYGGHCLPCRHRAAHVPGGSRPDRTRTGRDLR